MCDSSCRVRRINGGHAPATTTTQIRIQRLNLEATPKAEVLQTKRWRGVSSVQRRLESRHPLPVAAHSRIQAECSLRRKARNPPPPRLLADAPVQGRRKGLN